MAMRGLLLLLMVLLAGCAVRPPVSVDYEPTAAFGLLHTYGWAGHESKQLASENGLMDRRIRGAIAGELKLRGYREVAQTPDFWVDYRVRDEQRVRYEAYFPEPWPYYRGYPYYDPFYEPFPRTVAHPYVLRVLQLDILDRNRKLIWRGSFVGPPWHFDTPAEREGEIRREVGEILQRFPP